MSNNKNVIYRESKSIIDSSSGEILTSENTIVKRVKGIEEFMQVYLEDLTGLFKIETPNEMKLLALLWKNSEWNDQNSEKGNRIVVIKTFKEEWAKEIGCSFQTVNNTLSTLASKGLLVKKERMVYFLNPKYFFKGFSNDRQNVIRTILEYQIGEPDLEDLNQKK